MSVRKISDKNSLKMRLLMFLALFHVSRVKKVALFWMDDTLKWS